MIGTILLANDGSLEKNIVRDADGLIVSGLVIDNADYQNINFVCLANKGEYKNNPVLGVGAERFFKSVGRANDLRREINVQLDMIGYSRADVSVNNNGKFIVEI